MKIPLQEFAYDQCRELIRSGRFIPGELYSESAISKELGISRTPLRTALQRLEKEGLVTRLPQRGFRVNQFAAEDLEELFTIRKAIEGYAAEYLARHLAGEGIELYQNHLERQRRAKDDDDYRPFARADREFHQDLVKAVGNRRLLDIYAELRLSVELIASRRFKLDDQRHQSLADHEAIVEAIRAKDPTAARQAVYHHLDLAMELIKKEVF